MVVGLLCLTDEASALRYTIAYTGETHAMLEPCDCPVRPSGGIARRATVVRKVRKHGLNPTVLVDCGGMFAGGPYDEYTLGPACDIERTKVALQAAEAMGYDGIAVGDEELQYGAQFLRDAAAALPLLSVNLLNEAGQPVVPGYAIREVEGVRFGLIGVTPGEAFIFPDGRWPDGLQVGDPVESVARAVRDLRERVDIVVVLSHLGEAGSRDLLARVPGVDVLLNGHRLAPGGTGSLSDVVNGAIYANFSYQGRALGRVDLAINDGHTIGEHREWEMELSTSIEPDPDMDRLAQAFKARLDGDLGAQAVATVDAYVQSQCIHCREAEPIILAVRDEFGADRVEVRRRFVVHVGDDGSLESGTDSTELGEARRQVVMERLYPQVLGSYIAFYRDSPRASFAERAAAVGIDAEEVRRRAEAGEADGELLHDAELARRFEISLTPTLMVGNRAVNVDQGVTRERILSALCNALPGGSRPTLCQGLPECIDDSDCTQPGKVGTCIEQDGQRHCVYEDPVPVTLSMVTDPAVRFSDMGGIVASLTQMLPGLRVRSLDSQSAEAGDLLTASGAEWLPALFLDGGVARARSFAQIEPNLVAVRDGLYQLAPYSVGGSLNRSRAVVPGRLDLFLRPLDAEALEIAALFVNELQAPRAAEAFHLNVRFALRRGEDGALAAPGGAAEVEEAFRQAYILSHHADLYPAYLAARAEVGNSSYWDVPLRKAGLAPDEVRAGVEDAGLAQQLADDAALRDELGLDGALTLLVENREVTQLLAPGQSRDGTMTLSRQRLENVLDRLGVAAHTLTLCYIGHLDGQLEVCGCDGNPFGGAMRIASALRQIRDQDSQVVFLTAGDLFDAQGDPSSTTALLKALEAMRLDAMGLGDQEFSLGLAFLSALSAGSPLPMVSTNASAEGRPLGKSSLVVERGLVRVGVLSVLAPEAFALATEAYAKGVDLSDPIGAARAEGAALRARCDIVVALSHLGADGDRALAEAVPDIDVVIGAHTGRATHAAETVGHALMVEAGRDGAFLGVLRLRLDEGKLVGAGNRLISMDASIPEDGTVASIVSEHKAAQADAFAAVLAASERVGPEWRSESCGQCHATEYEQWQTTGHAQAIATLASDGEEKNPGCFPCHSSPVPGEEARLPNVGCTACHDVGPMENGAHTRVPAEPVAEAVCTACHTPMRSVNFRFDRYRPLAVHGRG